VDIGVTKMGKAMIERGIRQKIGGTRISSVPFSHHHRALPTRRCASRRPLTPHKPSTPRHAARLARPFETKLECLVNCAETVPNMRGRSQLETKAVAAGSAS
jgi:hypothetical protein